MSSQRFIDVDLATARAKSPAGSEVESTGKLSSRASTNSTRPPPADILMQTRFTTTVGVLLSMGLVAVIAHRLLIADSSACRLVGVVLVFGLGFFGHEWCWVHAGGLTRQKRAHFDESNILETYQPRARTHGHLFVPDPPTPGATVSIKDGDAPERSADEKAAWNASRDAHYKDMFAYAQRVAKEQEAMEKTGVAAPSVVTPPAAQPVEADIKTAIPATPKSEINTAVLPPPAEVAKGPTDLEQTARADTNDQGEPLYENIAPMEQELPRPPRPPVSEQIQNVAQMVARTVSSKVRTALDNKSILGALPSTSSTRTALAHSPPIETPKNEANKSKRG